MYLQIFINKQNFSFIKENYQSITLQISNKQQFVKNIIKIIDDLNQNGQNQLIITTKQNNLFTTTLYTTSCVLCSDDLKLLANSVITNQKTVPFLIDNQGNGVVKLFTIQQNYDRIIYAYSFTNNNYITIDFTKILNNYNGLPFNQVQKHFASFVDLNNDCTADMVLTSYRMSGDYKIYYLEIYQKEANNNYMLKLTVDLQDDFAGKIVNRPPGVSSQTPETRATLPIQINLLLVTFADLDNGGSLDLIFYYELGGKYYMKSLLNKFSPSNICSASYQGIFPFTDFDFFSLPDIVFGNVDYVLSQDSHPHFNDVDADGFPDIIILMSSQGYTRVGIWLNNGGSNLSFRKYQDQWKAYDLNNPTQALFYDYGQDGKMDIMIMIQQKKVINNITVISSKRISVINNLQSDTLHLKILPLSINSPFRQDEKRIQNAFGITAQWLFTDIDGHKFVKSAYQKYQFNYGVLQLPYAYAGLGRTNNYVQQLTVGYQAYGVREDWSPIIPNSQLMVYKQQGKWKLQTLLKNNERVNDVIYVSVLILFFMGMIIFYLNYKEAQEDKRDHYNFIQLIR